MLCFDCVDMISNFLIAKRFCTTCVVAPTAHFKLIFIILIIFIPSSLEFVVNISSVRDLARGRIILAWCNPPGVTIIVYFTVKKSSLWSNHSNVNPAYYRQHGCMDQDNCKCYVTIVSFAHGVLLKWSWSVFQNHFATLVLSPMLSLYIGHCKLIVS